MARSELVKVASVDVAVLVKSTPGGYEPTCRRLFKLAQINLQLYEDRGIPKWFRQIHFPALDICKAPLDHS